MNKKIWMITGCSSGLGKALVEFVIEKEDFVVATFRQQHQVDQFNEDFKNRGFAVRVDMSNPDDLERAVELVIQKFNKIDVLVNNAGYGMAGAVEETSMEEIKAIFETNLFGVIKLTQLVLPHMRKEKQGHIIQISSHGGFKAFAGFGIYNASKFALEGFSEALAQEILPLGIRLSIVEPGPFRTNFAGGSFKTAKDIVQEYNNSAGVFRTKIKAVDGKQEGDPEKAALAIYNLSKMAEPPLRLPLGLVALSTIRSKLEMVQKDLDASQKIAEGCVY